jgi:SAM-dependent methyltransferase
MTHNLPIPPEDLRVWVGPFADPAAFIASGKQRVEDIAISCGLRQEDSVLEVGCGCGRLARALAARLGPSGRYEGLDVAAPLLDWCKRELQPHLHNFSFRFVDVQARGHNPTGLVAAADFRFPYSDAIFDLAISASLFTHMLADGTENYVKEIARVLRPAGRLYATLFLFDAAAQHAVAAGETIFEFRHRLGPCRTFDPIVPEEGVACEEQWFLSLLRRAGFRVTALRRGDWRCRRTYEITQDLIAAVKD